MVLSPDSKDPNKKAAMAEKRKNPDRFGSRANEGKPKDWVPRDTRKSK